mmetsp:Transcript_24301/g.75162  ORF Transcript_24301/g.75162 Transcript_24301/m.75162 type:complete len:86 (+) Transcript_24301:792-1049(+)
MVMSSPRLGDAKAGAGAGVGVGAEVGAGAGVVEGAAGAEPPGCGVEPGGAATARQVQGVCHCGGSFEWMPGSQLWRQTATASSFA